MRSLASIIPAWKLMWRDKVNILFSLIPILLGILIYLLLGGLIFETMMTSGKELLNQYISEDTLGSVVYFTIMTILTVALFFMVNWTFVLLVNLIASPFNDFLSRRVEKQLQGEKTLTLSESFESLSGSIFKVVLNEIKKIVFILSLTLISFVFSYIPFLTPVSFLITVLLLAVQYLDYSWSRHELSTKSCMKDLFSFWFSYSLGGLFFFILVSIPLLNLMVAPWATCYFTKIWVERHDHRD